MSKIKYSLLKITAVFLISIACLIRFFYFEEFGTFLNDDIQYFGMANFILQGIPPTTDGINPHTLFPPGYPFIVALENIFLENYYDIKRIEFIFVTAGISLLMIKLLKLLSIPLNFLSISIICLTPFFLFNIATIGGSTEVWSSLILLSGTIALIKLLRSNNLMFLFIANSLFAFAYLIRPEGMVYFIASVLTIFFLFKNNAIKLNIKVVIKIFMSFIVPAICLIFPYIFFLYTNTGEVTISGKSSYNSALVSDIFDSGLDKYKSNFMGLISVLTGPFFLGPVIQILLLIFFGAILFKKIRLTQNDLILLIPIPFILGAMLYYLPWARALAPSLPVFVIFAIKGSEFLIHNLKINRYIPFIAIVVGLINLGITFLPDFLGKLDDNPKGYYKVANEIKKVRSKIYVYSRDTTLELYLDDAMVCTKFDDCNEQLDFLILSNSNHVKLTPSRFNLELSQFLPPIIVNIKDQKCIQLKTYTRGNIWFASYEC